MLQIPPPALQHRRFARMAVTAFLIALMSPRAAVAADQPETKKEQGRAATQAAPDVTDLIQQIRSSIVTIQVDGRDGNERGIGTGFVVDQAGLIATNFHVINEGRPFTVELRSGRQLKVVSVEASDRQGDLALIRVESGDQPLTPLPLAEVPPQQGTPVLAFGNPLGLRDSVVSGIVSAMRVIDGRNLIQLAMPVQPGNSGGPVVDLKGNVVGIVNMKSAVDDNLGFAIPVQQLDPLREQPNPVTIDRWVRLGNIDSEKWETVFGGSWQQRGGMIQAKGQGDGFGGRSLCLDQKATTKVPMEIAVRVRLDDESGAAGIAFFSDGGNKHYGFYPSNGRLRLTCFKGPSVYNWEVLQETDSDAYVPGHWNQLRVRIDAERIECFVNGKKVIESSDRQLDAGRIGLVKFRSTQPTFKDFQFGDQLDLPVLSEQDRGLLDQLMDEPSQLADTDADQLEALGQTHDAVSREISQRIKHHEAKIAELRRLADDLRLAPTLQALSDCLADDAQNPLLRGALLIAKLDRAEVDVDAYLAQVDQMAEEIGQSLDGQTDARTRREALHRYLFKENGFHGGRAEYYHPANSHLDRVIDDREGLPITLSILYMELGKRIGLQIEGVGLPGHFIVRDTTDGAPQLIDVFDQGKPLSESDAAAIVRSHTGRRMVEADLKKQDHQQILSRVLTNLIGVSSRRQDLPAIHRYCEAQVLVEPESVEARRMRAQIRAMTERTEAAINDLDWIIENDPTGVRMREAIELRNRLQQQP